ncbi:MAG: crotonase/enoyl-CoA hydratase family protein [Proteobacteria bacterium]|nr:crotonase/enoyl-CoA hydratase family protein [Pseudomonadota bacterium]
MSDLVAYDRLGPAARIRMDDGKVNVMNLAMMGAIDAALDRAAAERAIVVLSGRDNVFSAGFDLKVFRSGDAAGGAAMVKAGAELALKVLTFPMPVVTVAQGHAFPMGAFLKLSADWRIGTSGAWRIGLNEVAIGLTLPRFALEIARQRLAPAYFSRTAMTGEMYAPDEARVAGFLDQVVAPADLAATVEATVERLAALDLAAHAATKLRARAPAIAAVKAAMTLDFG